MAKTRILVVEDERIVAESIKVSLEDLGFVVPGVVSSGDAALRKTGELKPDLVLMDIVLQGEINGIQAADKISSRFDIPVVYLTAYADEKILERAKITEPFGYILKPFNQRELHSTIVIALYKYKMETRLRESEDRFRKLFEQSDDALFVHDLDMRILDVNRRACETLGYSHNQLLAMPFPTLYPKEALPSWREALRAIKERGSARFDSQFKKADGTVINVDVSSNVIDPEKGIVHEIVRDITERRKAEEKLRDSYAELQYRQDELIRSERLAFTGRIAASIAHEIRNPLTNVLMSVQQIKKAFKSKNPWAKHIDMITRNTERINYLITELLNCARPPKLDIHSYDMHRLLEGVLGSVQTKIKSQKVEVVKRFTSKPSIISMDKEQMERVFSNIILNAIEAMPRGGNLSIVTKVDGNLFVVKVEDTGEGIPEEDIIRIFDPFFSSKPSGVGLGLSICYGIIVSHGGTTEVESKPKEGTVFTVSLPVGGRGNKMRVVAR